MSGFSYLTEDIFLVLRELGGVYNQECLSQILEESQASVGVALDDLCNRGVITVYESGNSVSYGLSENYQKFVDSGFSDLKESDNFSGKNFYNNSQKISSCFYLKEKGRTIEACIVLFSCIDRFLENSHSFAAVKSLGLGIRYLQHWVDKSDNKDEISKFLELVLYAGDITMYLTNHFAPMLELLSSAKNLALHAGEFPAATLIGIVEACLENMRAESSAAKLRKLRQNLRQSIKNFDSTEYEYLTQLFSGMFYFWEGDFHDVLEAFKNADDSGHRNFDIWKCRFQSEMFALYTSSSAMYLNRFHQAVGILEAARRSSSLLNHRFKTIWWEAQLAMVLLYINKHEEALELINNVIHEADPRLETKIFFWAMRGLAYYHWRKGRIEFAYTIFFKALLISQKNSMKRPIYSYPWMLDMLYSFKKMKMKPIPGISFDEEMSRALEGGNKHLQAAALRTLATLLLERNASIKEVLSYFQQSESLFRKVGNLFEAAQTGLLIAGCLDAMHEYDDAGKIRTDSLHTLSSLGQPGTFYVDQIKFDSPAEEKIDSSDLLKDLPQTLIFLEKNKHKLFENSYEIDVQAYRFTSGSHLSGYDPLENCRFAFESLPPWSNFYQFLNHVVHIACSELGAERALLAQRQKDGTLEIKATSNISNKELKTGVLTSHLTFICKKIQRTPILLEKKGIVSLTIPLMIGENDLWILYMESVYAVKFLKNLSERYYKDISSIFSQELRIALRYADTELTEQQSHPTFTSSFFRTNNSESMVYESRAMRKLISKARQVATTEAPILIQGETGVGKELLAQYIHRCSGRIGNFIPVHPASYAENLFESEFFGHEKGAFTSAHRKKIGLVELAHNGTLFIDEVGDIPMALQTKVLRVFQDRRFWRVGGDTPRESNFRLVGATNKDLWQEVQAGRFRKDLYYRMAVIPLTVPPLRERKDDIPVLVKLFFSKLSHFYNKNIPYPEEKIFEKFYTYNWPGNIREMRNLIERAVILHRDNDMGFEMLLDENSDKHSNSIENNESIQSIQPCNIISDFPTLETLESRYIQFILDTTNGKVSGKNGALDILGMKRSTFYSKIKRIMPDKEDNKDLIN